MDLTRIVDASYLLSIVIDKPIAGLLGVFVFIVLASLMYCIVFDNICVQIY
jgi:hypothetical protein